MLENKGMRQADMITHQLRHSTRLLILLEGCVKERSNVSYYQGDGYEERTEVWLPAMPTMLPTNLWAEVREEKEILFVPEELVPLRFVKRKERHTIWNKHQRDVR